MSPFGVLHPLFVHFPFALVVVAAGLEVWSRRRDRAIPSPHTEVLLAIAAGGALLAAGTGWLAASGRDGTDAFLVRLAWHRWLGVASAVVIPAAWWAFRTQAASSTAGRLGLARALLGLSLALVAIGGHLGAEITHGRETYLAALDRLLGRDPAARGAGAAEEERRAAWVEAALSAFPVPPDAPIDYERSIQPILIRHCWSCHGPEKVRGGLRLDSRERALLGGDTGPTLVPGAAAESPLWTRCVEDSEEFPRMPEDAPPLPAAYTDALRRWIDAGAPWPEPEPTPWRRTEEPRG